MATGKKSSAARGRQPSRSRKAATQKAAAPAGVRREVWATVCAALVILSLLCLMRVDGFVLRGLRELFGALLGVGAYLLPLSFGGMSALLFIQRKGPVRLRGFCLFMLPVLFGGLAQGVLAADAYAPSMQTCGALLRAGVALHLGGLAGGWLYILLEWALSSIGAFLILVLLMVAAVFAILRLTPAAVVEMLRTPQDYQYKDEAEREKYEGPARLPNLRAGRMERRAKKQQIDIPLDDSSPQAPSAPVAESPRQPAAGTEAFRKILSVIESPHAASAASGEESTPSAPPQDDADALAAEISQNQQSPPTAYDYPPLSLLHEPEPVRAENSTAELAENSQRLLDTLDSFGIEAKILNIVRGPSVTRFEMTIERGVKFSRITALSEDIALSLGAVSVRIAPIPDKMAIGIEVPNKTTSTVFIRDVIGSRSFAAAKSRVAFAVGKDITGAPIVGDIAKMPHLLIAGTTGSGKSVCINSMLVSLLYKASPEEVRLIMVDPKMVELGNYNGIPHLLIPVVTDPKKASGALNWAVSEMERRYKAFADHQVRDLSGYNQLMRRKRGEAAADGTPPEEFQVLPQIVIVIDELADLMMVAAKEVETSICRIAQKARAAGMHLIVATQRPSADVITGIMKANIPSRISFAVASQIESRIILDQNGAEKLIGKGDMLYAPLGGGKPTRVQGCFIASDEIEAVISKVKEGASADYSEEILEHIERQAEGGTESTGGTAQDEDELLPEAIDVVMDCKQASVSMLQRRLKLGYSRAARIVDQMEERGIVCPFEGSKPRQILISREEWQEMKLRREKR